MHALRTLIADRIRKAGPISVAEYMSLALYHPSYGYYARASQRTGRTGDFFTSVDVGPVFGELLARQLDEMRRILRAGDADGVSNDRGQVDHIDLVEAAAGSGRLARDILDAAAARHRQLYDAARLRLIEPAPAARGAQLETLGPHAEKLASSSSSLPPSVHGVIFANELLDALPTHAVVMRDDGLREVFIDLADSARDADFTERELPPSTPELETYLARARVRLEPGWRAEINLQAAEWVREAARALRKGFLILIDYGYEANELYSDTHSAGTLMTFRHHVGGDRDSFRTATSAPGEYDITSHIDLTTVTRIAESEGLLTLGKLDQTYFLLGLGLTDLLGSEDAVDDLRDRSTPDGSANLRRRLALKTLVWPGGLGSALKVLIFGKDVGRPMLRGLSYGARLT